MARFDDEVLALNPTRVVIMIGINDVWRQFDEPSITSHHVLKSEYAENLQKMLEKCAQNNVIVSCITPFFMERNTDDAMRAKTDEYRAEMMRICKQNNVPCVDVQKAFDEYLKFRHPSYIMWDRVHPGEIGALIIAREYLRSVGFDRPII